MTYRLTFLIVDKDGTKKRRLTIESDEPMTEKELIDSVCKYCNEDHYQAKVVKSSIELIG